MALPDQIPVTDSQFKFRVEELPVGYKAQVLTEVSFLGAYFVMVGAVAEAQTLWDWVDARRAAQGSATVDLEGLRRLVGRWRDRKSGVAIAPEVEARVVSEDIEARRSLTTIYGLPPGDYQQPPLSESPKGRILRAFELAKPRPSGVHSSTELEAMAIFRDLLAEPATDGYSETAVNIHERMHAGPIAADIAFRNGHRDEAVALLRQWLHEKATVHHARGFWDSEGYAVSRVTSIVTLFCEGALADHSAFTAGDRAELVGRIRELASIVPARVFPDPDNDGSERGLVIRVDFSDDAAWEAVSQAILNPEDEEYADFADSVGLVSDPDYDGMTAEEITRLARQGYSNDHIFVVDHLTITHPLHPVLAINLHYDDIEPGEGAQPGDSFRLDPGLVGCVTVNLGTQNQTWEEATWHAIEDLDGEAGEYDDEEDDEDE